jgi:hypothetical protein
MTEKNVPAFVPLKDDEYENENGNENLDDDKYTDYQDFEEEAIQKEDIEMGACAPPERIFFTILRKLSKILFKKYIKSEVHNYQYLLKNSS